MRSYPEGMSGTAKNTHLLTFCCAALSAPGFHASAATAGPLDLGSRREPLVDDDLIDQMTGKPQLVLHPPTPREIVMVFDRPWEGNACAAYNTVFFDDGRYRMYYIAGMTRGNPIFTCYAESPDGVQWTRPDPEQFEYAGSRKNNIVMWEGFERAVEAYLVALRDGYPEAKPDGLYKAVYNAGGLRPMTSADGIHWSPMSDKPVITRGDFDSQNLAFWDADLGEYRAYWRGFRDGYRDILTATSKDFIHWTEPQWLQFPGAPRQELYTNQVIPYYRAPHILLGFPTRYIERGWSDSMRALPELEARRARSAIVDRYGIALTDGLFMSSRDGLVFHRWGTRSSVPASEAPTTGAMVTTTSAGAWWRLRR